MCTTALLMGSSDLMNTESFHHHAPPPLPTNKPKYIYFFTITSLSSSYSISPPLNYFCCYVAQNAQRCFALHYITQSLPLLSQTHVVWLDIFLVLLAPQANQRIPIPIHPTNFVSRLQCTKVYLESRLLCWFTSLCLKP